MRDRRTETIENSAATKKALMVINTSTASSREAIAAAGKFSGIETVNKWRKTPIAP
jgi:hypothetical protein